MNYVITGPSAILGEMIGYSGKSFLYGNKAPAIVKQDFEPSNETAFRGGFFEIFIPPINKLQLKQSAEGFEADYPPMQQFDYALISYLQKCASFLQNKHIKEATINWIRKPEQLNNFTNDPRIIVILHLADADAIDEELKLLDIFYALGMRSMGVTWSRQNQFGYGAPYRFPGHPDSGPGLSKLGISLVKKCNKLNILIDTAHLNEAGFRGVAENSSKPLVISHGTPHHLNASSRAFTDDMLELVAASNGIVGISLEGVKETSAGYAEDMVRHMEYVMGKVGDMHVGFGSDMVLSSDPSGAIKTLLPDVLNLLASKGYNQSTINKIAYKNWKRVLNDTL